MELLGQKIAGGCGLVNRELWEVLDVAHLLEFIPLDVKCVQRNQLLHFALFEGRQEVEAQVKFLQFGVLVRKGYDLGDLVIREIQDPDFTRVPNSIQHLQFIRPKIKFPKLRNQFESCYP